MTAHLANQSPVAAPDENRKTSHPLGFWFFFWGEFAERCSFYGMKTILPIYLTVGLQFADTAAGSIMNGFKMAAYFLPLLGGYLADRYFGKYWTIVGFSVPYVLGHFVLGIENRIALFIALGLLAGGSGVIKPNISTLMGQTYDEKRPGQTQLRTSAFLWYYFAINFGALISTFTLPYVHEKFGFAAAFQVPAWLMVAALLVFALGKRHYATETLAYQAPTPQERRERRLVLGNLLGVFGLIVFFWVGYEHNDNIWVFFVRDYVNLNVGLHVIGLPDELKPEQLQFINPLCVLICAPLLSWLFRALDPKTRLFTTSNKILMGFLLGAAASGVMAAAGATVSGSAVKISVAWPTAAYILLTVAEVLVYGTGLELAYAAAPQNLKGFVTACFLLTNTLANFINIWLSRLYGGSLRDPVESRGPLSPSEFFGLAAAISLLAAIAFVFVGRRLERRTAPAENAPSG